MKSVKVCKRVEGGIESVVISITHLPHRKNKCLCVHRNGEVIPLAYFKDAKSADEFSDVMDFILGAFPVEEEKQEEEKSKEK